MTGPTVAVDGADIAAASIDGVGVLEGTEYVFATGTLARIHGYDEAEQLVGRAWDTCYTIPDVGDSPSQLLTWVSREGTWRGAARARTRTGGTVPVQLSLRSTNDGIVCVVRDRSGAGEFNGERQPSASQYRQLIDTAPVPTGVFAAEGGIAYCNETAVSFLGATGRGEIIGRSPAEFVREDDREQFWSRLDQVFDGRQATEPAEYRLRGVDGTECIAEIATAPITYEGEPAAFAILNDVTNDRTAHERLGAERQFIENVLDALDDVLYVVDSDDTLVEWNERIVERLGYTDEELERMSLVDLLPEEHRDLLPDDGLRLVDLPNRTREMDIVTKDGDRIPHELRGVTYEDETTGERYRVGIARDITERRERERKLERCETIIETVDDGVYSLDDTFCFDFVNDGLCEMAGMTREELIGTPALDLFTDEDEKRLVKEIRQQTLADDTNTATIEGTYERDDGDTIDTEARVRLHPPPNDGFAGSVGVVRDITERKERERNLRAARQFNEELVENAPFGMFRLDEDLRITYENPRAEEIIGLPDDEDASAAIGTDIRELPSIIETGKADLFSRLANGETVEFEFPFESIYGKEAYFTGRGVPLYRDGEFDGAILMATDISERRQHERDLERQRDELATLNNINELLLTIIRELFEATPAETIEQIVCSHLADSGLYQFAWIGKPEGDGTELLPAASAGLDDDYVTEATVTTDERETGLGPSGRAFRTGEVHVSGNVATDPTFEPWRDLALERNIQSVVAVPLVYGGTTFGVLGVYTTRPLAFSQREQRSFEVLGEAIGFVIKARKTDQLLYSESITELELELELAEPASILMEAATELECSLELKSYLATDEGEWLLYLTVTGDDREQIVPLFDEDDRVRTVESIDIEGDTLTAGLATESSLLDTISAVGGKVTAATIGPDEGRITVEVSRSTDIRTLRNQIREIYPDARLVSRTDHERSVTTDTWLGDDQELPLTERQRQALEAGYRAGYFEWPRESTAEEVADLLGIARPTFQAHLRKAEHELISDFFDDLPREQIRRGTGETSH